VKKRKIGVMIESFRLGVKAGIEKAAEIGADGFQIYVTGGEMAPENMGRSARRDFKRFVANKGLVVSALCADYFKGFLNPQTNDETVQKTMACMDLAVDLGTNVITSHIGTIPEDEDAPEWRHGIEALSEVAAHGEKIGVLMACETGPESAELMLRFLDRIPGRTVGVNYDPANLVIRGFDQIGGVAVLGYDGFLTVEREVGDDPVSDIVKAVAYLRTL